MATRRQQFMANLRNNQLSISWPDTTNLDSITYNSRYPWFDKANYDKLESKIAALGLTGYEKEKAMDDLYIQVLPQVQDEIKNSDRRKYINQAWYEVSQIQDKNSRLIAKSKLTVTELTQKLKEKFNIDPTTNDEEVFNSWIESIPNWWQLLANYMNNWDKELLYAWGLEDREIARRNVQWTTQDDTQINQWWIKGRLAEMSENTEEWSFFPKLTELVNPIGYITEALDTWSRWIADKITVWTREKKNLITQINNLSEEDLNQYKEWYDKSGYNWSFEDYIIDSNKTIWQDLVWADEELKWIAEPNVFKFFGNMPASTLRLISGTVKWATNPYDVGKALGNLLGTKEGRQILAQRYWTLEGWANAMNYDSVGTAEEMLSMANSLGNLVSWAWRLTHLQWLQNAWNWLSNNIGSPVDVAVQRGLYWGDITYWTNKNNMKTTNVKGLYWVMDDLAWDSKILQAANRYAQDTSSLSKLFENSKSDLKAIEDSSFWQAIKSAKDEFINKLVWIDKWDRTFIKNNKELVNDYLDWKKNVDTLLDDVKNKINDKQVSNSEMGKEYNALREKGQTVSTEALASDMVDTLRKNKITINADGDLEFDKLSKYNPTQQKALQDAWQVIKDAQAAESVDAGTILDLRQKFDDKVNRTWKPTELRNMSSVDKATESLIKEMRWTIDARAKAWIDGLAELDSKYAPAMEEMKNIKKDWFDSDWKIKDNARSKIRNLTKAWNEEMLNRLEKVAPWITNDLKALDVWLTIEKASKQGVGQYSKWILAGSVPAWIANPIAWLAGLWLWILSTPKNYVKIIENYPDIASKLEGWVGLTTNDINSLQALAIRLWDTANNSF